MMEPQQYNRPELGWSLAERDRNFIQTMMPSLKWLYHNYFRVQTSGWHHIPSNEQVLIVGSHNGGFASPDTSMMMYDWLERFGFDKPIHGLMHPKVWQASPELGQLAMKMGAISAHPKMAIAALRSGASLLVYPGGIQDIFRPYSLRHQIYFAQRQGFIKLALKENLPIIPAISTGAHDTLIILADLYKILQQLHEWGMPWFLGVDPEVFPIYLGLPWGIGIGPLPNIPLPVKIHTRICPPIKFEKYGESAASDRAYVKSCYNIVVSQMQQELDDLVRESGV